MWVVVGLLACPMPASVGWGADRPAHPLDTLTSAELKVVGEVLRASGRFSPGTSFRGRRNSKSPRRRWSAACSQRAPAAAGSLSAIDFAARQSFAGRGSMWGKPRILSIVPLRGAQPGLTERDIAIAREIIASDARVSAGLRRHGISVGADGIRALYLGVGTDPGLQHQPGRLIRVVFIADQKAANAFGPVLDGLMAVVDVYARRVVRLDDTGPHVPPVSVPHDVFDPKLRGAVLTPGVSPVTAAGRSFAIDGHAVAWGHWRFRFGFNPREGLVLYQLGFMDGERRRSIVYRASVSETVSRYASAGDVWRWMEFFDEGTLGLGEFAVPVLPGRDVPVNAISLPAVLAASISRPLPKRVRT